MAEMELEPSSRYAFQFYRLFDYFFREITQLTLSLNPALYCLLGRPIQKTSSFGFALPIPNLEPCTPFHFFLCVSQPELSPHQSIELHLVIKLVEALSNTLFAYAFTDSFWVMIER